MLPIIINGTHLWDFNLSFCRKLFRMDKLFSYCALFYSQIISKLINRYSSYLKMIVYLTKNEKQEAKMSRFWSVSVAKFFTNRKDRKNEEIWWSLTNKWRESLRNNKAQAEAIFSFILLNDIFCSSTKIFRMRMGIEFLQLSKRFSLSFK